MRFATRPRNVALAFSAFAALLAPGAPLATDTLECHAQTIHASIIVGRGDDNPVANVYVFDGDEQVLTLYAGQLQKAFVDWQERRVEISYHDEDSPDFELAGRDDQINFRLGNKEESGACDWVR
jgi:hypothetical protein